MCGCTLPSLPSFTVRGKKEALRSAGHSLGQGIQLGCPMNLPLAFRLRQQKVPRNYSLVSWATWPLYWRANLGLELEELGHLRGEGEQLSIVCTSQGLWR